MTLETSIWDYVYGFVLGSVRDSVLSSVEALVCNGTDFVAYWTVSEFVYLATRDSVYRSVGSSIYNNVDKLIKSYDT